MKFTNGTVAIGAALVLALAGCSSDSSEDSESAAAPDTQSCPTAPAKSDAQPQWTLEGKTGELQMVAATDSEGPGVTVDVPFSVDETVVKTLVEGDGPVVSDTATVTVCYVGVNGRDGEEFDSAYATGASTQFPLDGVIPGFSKAIAGQKVGSKVGVAMTSEDGYASGNPSAGIEVGDTLIFEISILDAS